MFPWSSNASKITLVAIYRNLSVIVIVLRVNVVGINTAKGIINTSDPGPSRLQRGWKYIPNNGFPSKYISLVSKVYLLLLLERINDASSSLDSIINDLWRNSCYSCGQRLGKMRNKQLFHASESWWSASILKPNENYW